MNRYELDGVLADVRAGKHVVLVGRMRTVRRAFLEVIDRVDEWAQVRRSNGRESATHAGGGSLAVRSVAGQRGQAVDVLVVGYRELTESEHFEFDSNVRAIRATRPDLELIYFD